MIAGIFHREGRSEVCSSPVLEGAGGRVTTKESREGSWEGLGGGGAGQPGRKAPREAKLASSFGCIGNRKDERTLGFTDSQEALSGEVSLLANGCTHGWAFTQFLFFPLVTAQGRNG